MYIYTHSREDQRHSLHGLQQCDARCDRSRGRSARRRRDPERGTRWRRGGGRAPRARCETQAGPHTQQRSRRRWRRRRRSVAVVDWEHLLCE